MVKLPMLHDGTRRVWKLKNTLHGLTQAACEWHRAFAALLFELVCDRCHSDPALFVSKAGKCFIFLCVDDLVIFRESLRQPLVDLI